MSMITSDDSEHGVAAAANLALLARFYVRFADQAVSVARRLEFVTTGTLPQQQPKSPGPRPMRLPPVRGGPADHSDLDSRASRPLHCPRWAGCSGVRRQQPLALRGRPWGD